MGTSGPLNPGSLGPVRIADLVWVRSPVCLPNQREIWLGLGLSLNLTNPSGHAGLERLEFWHDNDLFITFITKYGSAGAKLSKTRPRITCSA